MQDAAPAVGGGGGRFFGGGDRRLRPHGHHHNQQAVKCPRCDSPNTKFCYYNNYNMSQPRHFCRSCRRYWTKGGVLRNVPVGGGCRKSKRSSAKAKQAEATQSDSTIADKSSSTSDQTTAQQEEGGDNKVATSSVNKNDDGLLVVGTEDKSTEFQHVLGGGTTSAMMGFSSVANQTAPYEDEFKAVDYDGDPGLFDLTAAVDPSYWTDQPSSLNFLP